MDQLKNEKYVSAFVQKLRMKYFWKMNVIMKGTLIEGRLPSILSKFRYQKVEVMGVLGCNKV